MAAEAVRAIVLFDGVCNLCNGTVRFIVRRDPAGYFHFAPLQSATAHRLLEAHGLPAGALSSIVLIEDGRAWTRSDAALRIARRLCPPWSWLRAARVLPRSVRDRVYDWVAANRYDWFGRRDECAIPTPELRERFLA